jgi:hypothetical protein
MIFNAEMVRAILSGQKTQTRRIVKNQREGDCWSVKPAEVQLCARHTHDWWLPTGTKPYSSLPACPHGNVGDRIWVRETWAALGNEDGCSIDWNENLVKEGGAAGARIYRASCEQKQGDYGLWSIPDDAEWKPHTDNMKYEGAWVPSIHMPRWASRILLEITNVRVERLNDISNEDAKAEGYPAELAADGGYYDPFLWFRNLWDGIYPEQSFKHNPWVWVIEFKRVQEQSND